MNNNTNKRSLLKYISLNKYMYILLIPAIIYYIIFHYIPLGGLVIAFQDFNIFKGVFGSEFVGLEHFVRLFNTSDFYKIFRNTLILGIYKVVFIFPVPIIIALLLNEIRSTFFKRVVQTSIYMPHFFSWVIVGGLAIQFLDPTRGVINEIIKYFGYESIHFMAEPEYFRGIVVLTSIWKEAGWGTIVYLAAISSVDPTLYEAAKVDGASRFRMIWNITLPSISTTVLMVFIINMGNVLKSSFEQIFVLYNPLVYEVGDVIETYVYRVGLIDRRYDFATAVGFFQSVVGLIFLLVANHLANKFGDRGII